MGITIKEAVSIAIREGKNYKAKLANTSLFILYRDREDNQLKYLEVDFMPDKYQHLTGLKLTEVNEETKERVVREHTALEFYRRCNNKPYITPGEVFFDNPKTIDLKMMALPYITQITKITKMTGEYNEKLKEKLEADFIIGGENNCIGISKYDDKDTYFPRSCLKENIKDITTYTSQVLAIFQKPIKSKGKYEDIKYVAKGLNLKTLTLTPQILEKISLTKYKEPTKTAP